MINREKLYDLIYDKADRLLKQHNPCNIHTENGKVKCDNSNYNKAPHSFLCCFQCHYKSKEGCTTNCLMCKLFLCNISTSAEESLQLFDYNCKRLKCSKLFNYKMKRLIKIAYKYNLMSPHTSKEKLFSKELSYV